MSGGRGLLDRMKTKNVYMILALVIVSTFSLIFLTYPSPSIRTVVSKTGSGIKNLHTNIRKKAREVTKVLTVDPVYLQRLGLQESGPTYPNNEYVSAAARIPSVKKTDGKPVIASGARPDMVEECGKLLNSVKHLLSGYKTIVYNLGLGTSDLALLNKICNSSWNCEVRSFAFDKYPSHVGYLDIQSYRPICIQEMLQEYSAVLWVDEGFYFLDKNISLALSSAKQQGIQTWKIKDPTSSFTHPKMFKYFDVEQSLYYFQHAVESSHLIIYNTDWIAQQVMLPWIKCALLEECINPPGAQNTGCNFYRRPLFRYTGCHRYDMSALNVILGKAFKFEENLYTSDAALFGNVRIDKLRAENKTLPEYEIRLGIVQQIRIVRDGSLHDFT